MNKVDTYDILLNGELKDFDKSKHYLEFKCSNPLCDVLNYQENISKAVISLRLRPNSGCYKCQSKILIKVIDKL